VLLKLLTKSHMFAELGVSGLPSKVMMASLIKLCIIGSEYGLKRGCLKMHSTIYRQASQRPLVADTSYVKNIYGRDVVGANSTDRGRNATKVSLLSDAAAVPIALVFHKGNKSDFNTLRHLLDEARRKTGRSLDNHISLYADKGYDSHTCRSICNVHGLEAHIPHRGQPTAWGGIQIAVEICFGRIDKFRRCILRYDSAIAQFKSFHYLACSYLVARA